MADTYTIFFYFREPEEMQQTDQLKPILQQLAARGYYVIAEEEWRGVYASLFGNPAQSNAKAENHQLNSSTFQPSISDQAWNQIEHFCQTKAARCELSGFWVADRGPGHGFDFRITLYNEDFMRGALTFSFDQDFFIPTNREEHYQYWLETLEVVYNTGHFLYAYQLDHSGFHQPTSREDLQTHGVTRLYPLNIFSSELVEQLGRERLLSAPAGLITPLDDNSILLIPYVSGSTLPDQRLESEPEEVANYLDLTYGDQ